MHELDTFLLPGLPFRELFDATPDGMLVVDLEGQVVLANRQVGRLFGWPTREISGQQLEALLQGDTEELGSLRERAQARGPALRLLGRRRDGHLFPVAVTVSPVLSTAASLCIVSVRDVSQDEEARGALEREKERTEAALAELESFSYSVAHDLRAPLRVIAGFSRAVLEDYAWELSADARADLKRVIEAASSMKHLIEDLLRLARVSQVELERQEVDVSAMVQSLRAGLERTNSQRSVQWIVQPGMVTHADPRLLRVLLENLLGNAWKFTSRKAKATIRVGQNVGEDGETRFFVGDDGAGFDMSRAGRLFSPFNRLHGDEDFEGTGIGLATVLRIVNRHQGRIQAAAAPDEGATFTFSLSPRKEVTR